MKKMHLICNAHLDPVWLWRKSEGMAEAMATFRIAADFCEKYDNFVFNHNESVLYEWVYEYEPELFERIKSLVKKGKWKIIGGWYLQPDVIMPSGESIIRQIRTGREFFEKHFGISVKSAVNFDPFGHSKGLVQILKKCGYENYVYMRPRDTESRTFRWKGFDGSEINVHRVFEWYNTPKGEAVNRIKQYIEAFPDREINLITWGIGNHGGGPSEIDLNNINKLADENKEYDIIHSDLDSYFNEYGKAEECVEESLMHCMVGCYTSMSKVKQGHRRLENKIALCETMLWQSGIEYDKQEFEKAEKALLFSEFHDILPGTCIKSAESDAVRFLNYGEEIADNFINKAFFKLCQGQEKAKEGQIPIIVYNPHPYPVKADFEVEFQPAEPNYSDDFIKDVKIYDEAGNEIPCQIEKPECMMNWDWRKKIVFHTEIKPMGVTRFNSELVPVSPIVKIKPYEEDEKHIIVKNGKTCIKVNKLTGLIDEYSIDGNNVFKSSGVRVEAYKDNEDPWGMTSEAINDFAGEFKLLTDEQANVFRGYPNEKLTNVRVIENGDVRTKVEAIFFYEKSYVVVTYIFSKMCNYIDLDVKTYINDTNTMFKLCFDTTLHENAQFYGQQMFGTEKMRNDGNETPFQKWCGLKDNKHSLLVINKGNYGGSALKNKMYVNLLRTAVYSASPNELGRPIALHDRMHDHIDMGESQFSFRIIADCESVDVEADIFNKSPYILSFFPSGYGEKNNKDLQINNKNIILSCIRKNDKKTLVRLYNSADKSQKTKFVMGNISCEIEFTPYEVKTYMIDDNELTETDILGFKEKEF